MVSFMKNFKPTPNILAKVYKQSWPHTVFKHGVLPPSSFTFLPSCNTTTILNTALHKITSLSQLDIVPDNYSSNTLSVSEKRFWSGHKSIRQHYSQALLCNFIHKQCSTNSASKHCLRQSVPTSKYLFVCWKLLFSSHQNLGLAKYA
jgi:hypothetical protein